MARRASDGADWALTALPAPVTRRLLGWSTRCPLHVVAIVLFYSMGAYAPRDPWTVPVVVRAPLAGTVSTLLGTRDTRPLLGEVLELLGAGLSNPEIAEELTTSVATVKSRVRHMLARLGLRDRVRAVVLAHEAGLVRPHTPRPSG